MAAGDLTDLATAKIATNLDGSTALETDQILGALISAISAQVPNALDREILAADFSEIYAGNGKDSLILRQRPILSISSIAWPGQAITAAGNAMAGIAGIWTDGRSARLSGYAFPLGVPIQIAYRAGFETVPLDMSLAVAELVAEAYSRRTHVGETSRSQGGEITIAFESKAMHAAIAAKLANYRLGAPC